MRDAAARSWSCVAARPCSAPVAPWMPGVCHMISRRHIAGVGTRTDGILRIARSPQPLPPLVRATICGWYVRLPCGGRLQEVAHCYRSPLLQIPAAMLRCRRLTCIPWVAAVRAAAFKAQMAEQVKAFNARSERKVCVSSTRKQNFRVAVSLGMRCGTRSAHSFGPVVLARALTALSLPSRFCAARRKCSET